LALGLWLLAFGSWQKKLYAFSTSERLQYASKGSAEDEHPDSAAKFAKIRPMRVEMYGMNWNDD